MKKIPVYAIFGLFFALAACSQDDVSTSSPWLIPSDEVVDGGPGKDGIPSIDDPQFSPASSITFLDDNDLVLGIRVGEDIRAYPHPILDWHEIVNGQVDTLPVAITYCPLTGTGIGWRRVIEGEVTTFGVSGLLYNTNLIPYDRRTNSNWSQMLLQSVNGTMAGADITTFSLVETRWRTWLERYPDSQVLNRNTGFARNYNQYPYGDYRTNNQLLLFPVDNNNTRFPAKDRGLGVIVNGKARFYHLGLFTADTASSSEVVLIQENFNGIDLIVAGSKERDFIVAYQRRLPDGTLLSLQPAGQSDGAILSDEEGNRWDIFGHAVEGPRQGQRLPGVDAYIGFWFAWAAFYEGIEVYE